MKSVSARPWGELQPRGLAALCLAALRRRPPGDIRRFLYRVMECLGPYYDVGIDGMKFRCRFNDNWAEMSAIIHGTFIGNHQMEIIDGLKQGDTFVDIGANAGFYSCYAARAVGPIGTVLAIEPNPMMIERIEKNAALNDFTNIRIGRTAIGETAGTAELQLVPRELGRSSMHVVDRRCIPFTVPIEPLNSVVMSHGINRIDAMKIDIEGYEDRALAPFFDAAPISLWPRRILVEIVNRGSWQTDCIAQLANLGYEVLSQDREDALLAWPAGR